MPVKMVRKNLVKKVTDKNVVRMAYLPPPPTIQLGLKKKGLYKNTKSIFTTLEIFGIFLIFKTQKDLLNILDFLKEYVVPNVHSYCPFPSIFCDLRIFLAILLYG